MLYICKGLNVSYILLKPCNAVSACRALDTKLYLCVHLHNTGFLIHLGGIFAWEKDILLAWVIVGLLQDERLLRLQWKAVFLQGRQNCMKIDKSLAAFRNWSGLPCLSSTTIRNFFYNSQCLLGSCIYIQQDSKYIHNQNTYYLKNSTSSNSNR